MEIAEEPRHLLEQKFAGSAVCDVASMSMKAMGRQALSVRARILVVRCAIWIEVAAAQLHEFGVAFVLGIGDGVKNSI